MSVIRPVRQLFTLASALLLCGLRVGVANAQFEVSDAFEKHAYSEYLDQLIAPIAHALNTAIDLQRPVEIISGQCEAQNAFFVPASGTAPDRIVICTELLDLIASQIQPMQLNETEAHLAFGSQTLFILLHEMGHAIIRVLDIPTLGQEEDAADQFAALVLSSEPVMAMWAARMWSPSTPGIGAVTFGAYSDSHGLGPQRYFNVLCWTYGADPYSRSYVARLAALPDTRAQTCAAEFEQMHSSWQKLLEPHAGDGGLGDVNARRNASGQWRFIESMEAGAEKIRCSASGTLELWQVGEVLAGTMTQQGSCIVAGVPIDNSATAAFEGGSASDDGIHFVLDTCVYDGRFTDETLMTINGSVRCAGQSASTPIVGSWRAVR